MKSVHKFLIGLAIGVGVAGIGGSWIYGSVVSTKNEGVQMEQQLSATYEDNQNYLSAFVSTFYETTHLANLKSEKLDSILVGAVRGRYGDKGFSAQGSFFAAVAEAYPNLSQLDVYDKIVTQVQAGRTEFRGRQSVLLDQLRGYETWQRQGLIRPIIVRSILGFPSDMLKARVGGKTVATGALALEQFHSLVVTDETATAFSTGRMAPLTAPKN